jgi:hypothetical protein
VRILQTGRALIRSRTRTGATRRIARLRLTVPGIRSRHIPVITDTRRRCVSAEMRVVLAVRALVGVLLQTRLASVVARVAETGVVVGVVPGLASAEVWGCAD